MTALPAGTAEAEAMIRDAVRAANEWLNYPHGPNNLSKVQIFALVEAASALSSLRSDLAARDAQLRWVLEHRAVVGLGPTPAGHLGFSKDRWAPGTYIPIDNGDATPEGRWSATLDALAAAMKQEEPK